MKKTLGLFAALAVTFLMSADLHSASEGAGNNSREIIVYCALNYSTGLCEKAIEGDACYLVDKNCNWMDDTEAPDA